MVEVSGTSLATEKQCDHQLTFSLANDKKKPSRQTVLFIHEGTYPSHLSIGIADVLNLTIDISDRTDQVFYIVLSFWVVRSRGAAAGRPIGSAC